MDYEKAWKSLKADLVKVKNESERKLFFCEDNPRYRIVKNTIEEMNRLEKELTK